MSREKPGKNFSVPAPERRSLPRYSVDEDSALLLLSHGAAVPGSIENLSLSGCRVRTRERISAKAGSRIEIKFKVNGAPFRFNCVLAWTHGRDIAGIRFLDVIPRRKAELAEILGEIEAASAARAETSNDAAASQENLQPALPAASASSTSDRRTCARHAVDTSAVIFLIKVGSVLRGRILDLSQSGCRVRTDERFPVGIFTRVETEFRLQGLPFRLGGVIQALHDRNTVGIRFLDLSDRKRQQVAELIGEMQQIQAAQMAAEAAKAEDCPAPDGS